MAEAAPVYHDLTLTAFIRQHGITMLAEPTDTNPNMATGHGWQHWRCTLQFGYRQLTVYFSQGPAICREPTAEDVLDCLALDASGLGGSFEDWCAEFDYNTDSRIGERTYRTIEKQSKQLQRLIGTAAYETLLQLERL